MENDEFDDLFDSQKRTEDQDGRIAPFREDIESGCTYKYRDRTLYTRGRVTRIELEEMFTNIQYGESVSPRRAQQEDGFAGFSFLTPGDVLTMITDSAIEGKYVLLAIEGSMAMLVDAARDEDGRVCTAGGIHSLPVAMLADAVWRQDTIDVTPLHAPDTLMMNPSNSE